MVNGQTGFDLDEEKFLSLLKADRGSNLSKDALSIANSVKDLIKPKFIAKKVNIDGIYKDSVVLDGIVFKSETMANLMRADSICFAFIATGGSEVALHIDLATDYFEKYVLDQVAYMGCLYAIKQMEDTIIESFNIKSFISLAPGSLPDWDVIEVKNIFNIIGEDYRKIGVNILESGMVEPVKSVSGIIFENDKDFHSCDLCLRQNCPTRI